MDLILDTHLILWALVGSEKLPKDVKLLMASPKNNIYFSIASMWEVSIKHAKNKLPISGTEFFHYCEQAGFRHLAINDSHVLALETLHRESNAVRHKDPFDRILLAQAKSECMQFFTHDVKFAEYNEPYVSIV